MEHGPWTAARVPQQVLVLLAAVPRAVVVLLVLMIVNANNLAASHARKMIQLTVLGKQKAFNVIKNTINVRIEKSYV